MEHFFQKLRNFWKTEQLFKDPKRHFDAMIKIDSLVGINAHMVLLYDQHSSD